MNFFSLNNHKNNKFKQSLFVGLFEKVFFNYKLAFLLLNIYVIIYLTLIMDTTTTSWIETTTHDSNGTESAIPSWAGFVFLIGSSFFYGSNYLPVKQYETGIFYHSKTFS